MPLLDLHQYALGTFSGALIGLFLGMFGGGGTIIAVPLMVYLVGVPVPHIALGTSAFVVAVNAATSLASHARRGTVEWRYAALFSAAGSVGAYAGSTGGKMLDGDNLMALFALLMLIVGGFMLSRRRYSQMHRPPFTRRVVAKVLGYGAGVGAVSGFFGIGGGFLIVPALIAATGMPILGAVASSLVAVTAFGLTTAINYSAAGLVDWPLAGAFICGGIFGGMAGAGIARRLSVRQELFTRMLAS